MWSGAEKGCVEVSVGGSRMGVIRVEPEFKGELVASPSLVKT